MGQTIRYYNCFINHNNNHTNLSIGDYVDAIIGVNAERRFKHLTSGNICLIGAEAPGDRALARNNQPIDYRIRRCVFAKYRENKPYLGTIGTDRLDEIADDVIETTSVTFFPQFFLMAIEFSFSGAREKAVTDYLSSFLPFDDPNNSWSIELVQINTNLRFDDVRQSRKLKQVELKLDLSGNNRTIFHHNEEYHSVIGDLIGNAIGTNQELGVNTTTLNFSKGRSRNNILNHELFIDLLAHIDMESSLFESIKVTYESPTTNRTETIDLKNEGVLKSILDLDDNASWELITNETVENYYLKGQPGSNQHRNYEKVHDRIPNLRF
ncbi:DUF6731 family protein [Sporolactobacillus laevolacticus]|uniref:Uncharacterized protein n=1 Tax=Sporolactobacillus laevolacticus DSM 442 TaxID=1395513 RepID=V6IZJ4_9BACL|nr:DUF6731 family protein [Sporolactobacillus laevolacticus]EST12241.1 hypothetical protein P343_08215 [Sporolactobacillus laevolacticus DSM 442]